MSDETSPLSPPSPNEGTLNLPSRLAPYAAMFVSSGQSVGVPPALLAAICDRESGGGLYLTPKGAAGTGDGGHGRGLMQIDDRTWATWLDSNDWGDPAINIQKGAEIFADGLNQLGGDISAAIAAYNAGPARAKKALAAVAPGGDPIAALNKITTGGDYVSWVIARMNSFG